MEESQGQYRFATIAFAGQREGQGGFQYFDTYNFHPRTQKDAIQSTTAIAQNETCKTYGIKFAPRKKKKKTHPVATRSPIVGELGKWKL